MYLDIAASTTTTAVVRYRLLSHSTVDISSESYGSLGRTTFILFPQQGEALERTEDGMEHQ